MRKQKVLSLFSGCGGMDLGIEGNFTCLKKSINRTLFHDWVKEETSDNTILLTSTIFETVFANDIRTDAKVAWNGYFSRDNKEREDVYHIGSIVDLVKQAREKKFVFPPNIDVVTGGFPCCDFSVSGLRQGFNSNKDHMGKPIKDDVPSIESRGSLYMWMRDVITITEPKLFIAENVKGLTNLGDVKTIIENDFANAGNGGYLVVPARVLYAPDYGVPQSRERVIFFGFKKSALNEKALKELSALNISTQYDPYPMPTHEKTGDRLPEYVNCSDAFNGLEEPNITSDLSQKGYSKAKYMGRHCQGQTEVKLNSVAPTIRAEHHGNIEFRRLSKEHGGTHDEELKNGMLERRLSVRECARIQTFPDDYQFVIHHAEKNKSLSVSSAYKIIGNAVPPVLAYNIAKNLERKWDLYFD